MPQRPELVIGFVAPVGVRMSDLVNQTAAVLRGFKYEPVEIRLSGLLQRYTSWTPPSSSSEDVRILHSQAIGHEFRQGLGDAAGLALAALVAIREHRAGLSNSPDKPADAVAYL